MLFFSELHSEELIQFAVILFQNKKVLLRKRKRHTACRIVSARCADQSPDWGGEGVPHPVLDRGRVPHPVLDGGEGLPHPILDVGWVTPSSPGQGGTPIKSWPGGYPVILDGVPPISRMGSPLLDLGGHPSSRPRMEYPPVSRMGYPLSGPGMGYPTPPPGKCEQTENITFPYPSDAGGNKGLEFMWSI